MRFGIIAGGEGSRLAAGGMSVPKPLAPVCGVPVIERIILSFIQCNPESISVVVNEGMPEVAEYILSLRLPCTLNIKSVNTPSSLHSFDALVEIMGNNGKCIVTTADTVFNPHAFLDYVSAFENIEDGCSGLMAVTSFVDDEKPLYVKVGKGDRIAGFLDDCDGSGLYVSGGIYGLTHRAFPVLENCMVSGVSRMRNFQKALLAGGLDIRAFDMGKIVDVDRIGDIEEAEKVIRTFGKGNPV